jgi:hypothetical protein
LMTEKIFSRSFTCWSLPSSWFFTKLATM